MGKDLKGKELGKGITQRKDGIYQARIFQKGYGKPIYLYDNNLRNLKIRHKEIQHRKEDGIQVSITQQLFKNWFEQWMTLYKIGALKNTTIRNYITAYKRIEPYIGNVKLCEMKPLHIQYAIRELEKLEYSQATIKTTITVVSCCLDRAVKNRIILTNPCSGLVYHEKRDFSPNRNESQKESLTRQEVSLFFQYAKNTRYIELFYILLHTGMRIGELCSLQWSDIDFDKKYISVYKTINRTEIYYSEKGEKLSNKQTIIQITTPKREASVREIPITDEVIKAFLNWKDKQMHDKKILGKKWGKKNKFLITYPDLIFTTKSGNCFLPSEAARECKRIAEIINKNNQCDIHIHPHLFRHTFITNCYESGVDPLVIMLISGHKDIDMMKHYTHPGNQYIVSEFEKYIDAV